MDLFSLLSLMFMFSLLHVSSSRFALFWVSAKAKPRWKHAWPWRLQQNSPSFPHQLFLTLSFSSSFISFLSPFLCIFFIFLSLFLTFPYFFLSLPLALTLSLISSLTLTLSFFSLSLAFLLQNSLFSFISLWRSLPLTLALSFPSHLFLLEP